VDGSLDNGALSRAVCHLRSAAGGSNLLGAVDSAGLLRNRNDRGCHLDGLRLGEADSGRVGRGQS
jgi:hypothetical protein